MALIEASPTPVVENTRFLGTARQVLTLHRGCTGSGAFVGKPIDQLSSDERIAHYRELGLEAMGDAQKATADHLKAAWLNIAASWAVLADEVERQTQREARIATTEHVI